MTQEGFVICDSKFNRVKMKSPQYAAISHLGLTKEEIVEKGLDLSKFDAGVQNKWMLNIVMTNEHSEFLAYYPQYTSVYNDIKSRYDKYKEELISIYDKIKDISNQREYAQYVSKHPFSGIFFQLKAGRIKSVNEGLINTKPKKILSEIMKSK